MPQTITEYGTITGTGTGSNLTKVGDAYRDGTITDFAVQHHGDHDRLVVNYETTNDAGETETQGVSIRLFEVGAFNYTLGS